MKFQRKRQQKQKEKTIILWSYFAFQGTILHTQTRKDHLNNSWKSAAKNKVLSHIFVFNSLPTYLSHEATFIFFFDFCNNEASCEFYIDGFFCWLSGVLLDLKKIIITNIGTSHFKILYFVSMEAQVHRSVSCLSLRDTAVVE